MNREVRKLAWFVWRNYPPAKDWGREILMRWLDWAYSHQFTAAFKDENETVVALGIARPVMDVEEARYFADAYDDEGHTIFVDLAIAPDSRVFKGLGVLMRRRFGVRDKIAFMRWPDPTVRSYNYRRMMQLTMRKETAHGNA